jgi:hypothetical protein
MADLCYETEQGAELEEIRMNWFLRVLDGKNFVALDEMCKIMNFLMKALNLTNDAEQISEMTSWLMLLNHAKNHFNKHDVPHKNSTPPAMTAEQKAIFDLLSAANVLSPTLDELDHGFKSDLVSRDP